MSKYKLVNGKHPWISKPDNRGDVGDLQDITDELNELLRERDKALEARNECERQFQQKMDEGIRLLCERDEVRALADDMAEKAKELITRWDQPSWKDTAPTAGFIYALRDAVQAYEKRQNY